VAKSSALYSNEDWDLVDAKKKGKKLADMPATALPPEMAAMPAEKREEYVAGKAKDREKLQRQIAEVNNKREAYIKAERAQRAKASAKPGAKALDDALGESIRSEAVANGFAF
jgi:hypothetical protein